LVAALVPVDDNKKPCAWALILGAVNVQVLRRICSAAEYRRDVDEAALGRLIDIETRQGLGQLEATTAEEHKISLLEEWGKEIDGRTLFVGAIDVSTHEFETSGTWQEKRRGRGDVYLSDMAVHPKFQRLGIGQLLFSSAVQVAQSQGFLEAHLHVEDVNKGAIDLYRSAGFELAPDDECALDLFRALVFPPPPAPKNILMTKRLSA
jgi:ribosomal protein S18 acetylase RimI-like enzyme